MATILTSSDVCRQLNVPYHRLEYAFYNGLIKEVARTSNGRRIYTQADVHRISKILRRHRNG